MKRRSIIILVVATMLVAVLGIGLIVSSNLDVIKAAFSGSDTADTKSASQLIVSVSAVLLSFVGLLIIFFRLLKSDNFIAFGKKDAVTGIGNRNFLEGMYKHQAIPFGYQIFLVYFAFPTKTMVDKYNVTLCNLVQKKVAEKLMHECMKDEYVARLDDGEFAMILTATDGLRAEKRIVELVNDLNQCQYQVLFEIPAPFSSGFCNIEESQSSFSGALQNAKTAYQHSVSYSLDTHIYSGEITGIAESNKRLAKKLTDAIKNDEFELFVQFVYDVSKQKFVGVEALSRWNSADGFILPAGFIGDMHVCGLIELFDMYVFDKTCKVLQEWKDDSELSPLYMSCNMTRATLSSRSFIKKIKEIAARYDFPHNKLMLEITEDSLIDNMDVAYENLVACREMGFKIALDDFGAGNTSFTDINDYPLDQVKIDRQFAKKTMKERSMTLLNSFVEMAHKLDLGVVFEGVETKEEANAVKKLHIDYIQGHYYSYVYPMSEVHEKLENLMK